MSRLLLSLAVLLGCNAPDWGANALLHPSHRASHGIPDGSESFEVDVGEGVVLKGWWARGLVPRRGLIVWLHGVGDNKDSGEGFIERWANRGFDVAAYDSRAHGRSGGKECTYGFREKEDVRRVLDVLAKAGADADRTLLIGFSMGAAVALQAAPLEPRVRAVVALAPFVDLREAAGRAAPFWMGHRSVDAALERAEIAGRFRVDDVSPRVAVSRLQVPLLIVHGKNDRKLLAAGAQSIHDAAATRDKELVLVDDAHHDNLFDHKQTWAAIDRFVDRVSPPDGRK